MSNYDSEIVAEGQGAVFFESRTRVVLIGNTQTGKTSLIQRYFKSQFENTAPTICCMNFTRVLTENSHRVVINYCDTAGQEKYRSISQIYYRDAIAAILVFDITDRKSFDDIESWVTEYRNTAPSPCVFIAANKIDLKDESVVSVEEIDEKSKELNAKYLFTSAYDGTGVEELFAEMHKEILDVMRSKWKIENPNLNSENTLTPKKESDSICNC